MGLYDGPMDFGMPEGDEEDSLDEETTEIDGGLGDGKLTLCLFLSFLFLFVSTNFLFLEKIFSFFSLPFFIRFCWSKIFVFKYIFIIITFILRSLQNIGQLESIPGQPNSPSNASKICLDDSR